MTQVSVGATIWSRRSVYSNHESWVSTKTLSPTCSWSMSRNGSPLVARWAATAKLPFSPGSWVVG